MENQNFKEQGMSETNDGVRFVRATGGEISKWQLLVEYVQIIIKINICIIASIFKFFFPRRNTDWEKEIVLITGSAGYVGKNLAAQIAMKGARVVLWDINETENAIVAGTIKEAGGKAFAYQCDLANKDDIEIKASQVEQEVGKPTIVINNAGTISSKPFLDLTEKEVRNVLEINTLSHFWILQRFLPVMLQENHGHVVAVASIVGCVGFPGMTEYATSKGAVIAFMNSLRKEISDYDGVHCTIVNPTVIDTEMFRGFALRLFPHGMEVLKPEYVAKKIVDAIETKQVILHLPRTGYVLPILSNILPVKAVQCIDDFLDIKHAMKSCVGRTKKNE